MGTSSALDELKSPSNTTHGCAPIEDCDLGTTCGSVSVALHCAGRIGKMLGGCWISLNEPAGAHLSYLCENWSGIRGLESAFPTTSDYFTNFSCTVLIAQAYVRRLVPARFELTRSCIRWTLEQAALPAFADPCIVGELPPHSGAATTVQSCEPQQNPSIDPARKEIPTQAGSALVPLPWIRAQNPPAILLTSCGYIIQLPSTIASARDSILLLHEETPC